MPLYEFQCTECHSTFEELVRVSAPATESGLPEMRQPPGSPQGIDLCVEDRGASSSGYSASASSCAPSG